jgi:hypothetical protein
VLITGFANTGLLSTNRLGLKHTLLSWCSGRFLHASLSMVTSVLHIAESKTNFSKCCSW